MVFYQEQKKRVKHIGIQISEILRLMEENSDCYELVPKMSAIRTKIDREIGILVSTNLEDRIRMEHLNKDKKSNKAIDEAINLIIKSG